MDTLSHPKKWVNHSTPVPSTLPRRPRVVCLSDLWMMVYCREEEKESYYCYRRDSLSKTVTHGGSHDAQMRKFLLDCSSINVCAGWHNINPESFDSLSRRANVRR